MELISLLNFMEWRLKMTPEYQELINQTFCDNSIRSVMMIDDDFLSYSECIEAMSEGTAIQPDAIEKTKRASEVAKFFQNKKVLCDIDNNIDVVEIDRIRKCDLLLLDYHLESNDPSKSLTALKSLRDSKHMNLVVIYTSEPLEQVWREVGCSLRGHINSDSLIDQNTQVEDDWLELTQGGAELPSNIFELVSANEDVASYLLTGKFQPSTTKQLSQVLRQNTRNFLKRIGEAVSAKSNLLNNIVDECKHLPTIHGSYGDKKWLCVGNVFISFFQKSDEGTNDAEGLWSCLRDSLHDWSPSYYRLITSEIQNHIEDQNLAMEGFLEQDYLGQAAWLWKLRTSEESSHSEYEQLCSRVSEGLLDSLLSDKELHSFSQKAIEYSIQPAVVGDSPQNTEQQNDHAIIQECANHVSSSIVKTPISEIVHALNQSVSSKKFTGIGLTVGTIIKCTSNDDWYLCVSPACETIPNQLTDSISKRITPDRFLKFIQLNSISLDNALENAAHGKYIFIRDGTKRIALSVLHTQTNQPIIEFGQVLNHDTQSINDVNHVEITFMGESSQRKLHVVGQLREAYSARFQGIASQHEGRVGVDFHPIMPVTS